MMNTIDNATDIMETTEHVKRAMKLLEMIDSKLDDIETSGHGDVKQQRFELIKELPNLHVLANTSRDLLADEYQKLNATYGKWLDDEMADIAKD